MVSQRLSLPLLFASLTGRSGHGLARMGRLRPLASSASDGPDSRAQGGCRWTVQRLRGPVSELLQSGEPPAAATRVARIHTVTGAGLVLGSTQSLETADQTRAAAAGAEILRRRSGGGAVLLLPGRQVWVDFFVPASDPLWSDDVAQAAQWVGELWSEVVEPFVAEPISVHSGRLVADRWGRLVCFAGSGPGEVFAGGRKVVGVSQRRTRSRVRIQTTARLRRPDTAASIRADDHRLDELDLLDVAAADRETGRALMASRCGSVPATEADLAEALLGALEAQARDTR